MWQGILSVLAIASALSWLCIWILPWRPWSVCERLTAADDATRPRRQELASHDDVTVLIPARNEAATIGRTLVAVAGQGEGLEIIVVDDQSTDGTRQAIAATGLMNVKVVTGQALPRGWSGKVWALYQAEGLLRRPLVWLLDADIETAPGLLTALRRKIGGGSPGTVALVSLMAELPMGTMVERLVLPPFIYFFKLLYPFALSNAAGSRVAAAAGGCVLLRVEALHRIGGFAALRAALIDDCTLAALVKREGFSSWTGLSRSLYSRRPSGGLKGIWALVSRTAFTQLCYSVWLLLACTAAMVVVYMAPVLVAVAGDGWIRWTGAVTWVAMTLNFWPTVRFYCVGLGYAIALPVAAALYLAMTWASAIGYWRGTRSRWKARDYRV